MLDDTWRKMRAHPNNVIVIPEYEASTIMGDDSNSDLVAARNYLLQVLSENVRKKKRCSRKCDVIAH